LDFRKIEQGAFMRPRDRELSDQLRKSLIRFHRKHRPLHGIQTEASRNALIEQILESVHRIKYVAVMSSREISPLRTDPSSEIFDPVRAAALYKRQGKIDEAFWLVFLFVHFGKNLRTGWQLVRDVYGGIGGAGRWDWERTSADPKSFRKWLEGYQRELKKRGLKRSFGNHRKYESLDAWSNNGTGEAVASYVQWIGPKKSHSLLFEQCVEDAGKDPRKAFHSLYHSMNAVMRFGRTAKFDYLTMIGKLGLAGIEPGSTYMEGATGPLTGARLLFAGNINADLGRSQLDEWLIELGNELNIGMQVIEDSLCNWQKSPDSFRAFRG
jgi:hypothetical protein